MRCRDVDKLCTRYVDGELDDQVASALRGHLRTCSECRARVEDEVAIRDAAADLEPIDPPAGLWSAVEARLAEAEIADAERSRLWFWWRGLRQHALPVAVGVAAVVVLVVWNSRRDDRSQGAHQTASRIGEASERREAEPALRIELPEELFLEAREREVLETDATYASAIAELKAAVAAERGGWSPAAAKEFDTKLAELEQSARQHVRALAIDRPHTPESRDALYTAYNAQIGLMQRAVLEELLQ